MSKATIRTVVGFAAIAVSAWFGGPVGAAWASAAVSVDGAIQARREQRRRARQQRDAYNAGLVDRTATIVSADNPWQIVFGEATVGPAFVAVLTSGDKDQYKHIVAVWAHHRCHAVLDTFLNGQSVGELDADGWVQPGSAYHSSETAVESEPIIAAGDGTLHCSYPIVRVLSVSHYLNDPDLPTQLVATAGPGDLTFAGNVITLNAGVSLGDGNLVVSYEHYVGGPRLRVRHHLGADDQEADAALLADVPDQWSSSDRGRGLCYSVFTFDLNEPEFQNGPPKLTARLEGGYHYDPRLDDTVSGGSGPQRIDDPSTWGYTRVPPICTAGFLRAEWGKGAATNQIDWVSVRAAANACGETVMNGDTPVPRYLCDGAFRTDEDGDVTLDQLCQSMAGFATNSGGVWSLQAGAWSAPVMTLADADNAGPVEATPSPAAEDVLNGLRGRFYDPAREGEITDYPPYQNTAFVTEDGAPCWDDLDLPYTQDAFHAHNLARVQAERSRGMVLVYPAKMRAIRLRPGQRVALGCSALNIAADSVFRVVKRESEPGAPVKLTLAFDDPTFYDEVDAPATLTPPEVTYSNPFRVAMVQGLELSSGGDAVVRDDDGGVISRAKAFYDASTDALVLGQGAMQIEFRRDVDAAWQRTPEAPGDSTEAPIAGMLDNCLYLVRARWRNGIGVVGDWVCKTLLTAARSNAPGQFTMNLSAGMAFSNGVLVRTAPTPAGTWSEQAWSSESYLGAAYLSFEITDHAYSQMIGLNDDPTANASYTSIDFAWYIEGGLPADGLGRCIVYESGDGRYVAGNHAPGDTFAVWADGDKVRFLRNGAVVYTSAVSAAGRRFFFDSSFADLGASVKNIRLGPSGLAGQTSYVHIRWSNDGGSTFTAGGGTTPGAYMGTRTDFSAAASTSPADYAWALVKGADGTNGIPGTNGTNGLTSYLHVKWSNDGGSSFTAAGGETPGAYVGTYTDFTAADSTNPAAYTWALVKGADGINGTNGTSAFTGTVYIQATSAPSAPSGGSYDFSSGALTPPTGCSATQPSNSTTANTYAFDCLFTSATPGAAVAAGTWTGPRVVYQAPALQTGIVSPALTVNCLRGGNGTGTVTATIQFRSDGTIYRTPGNSNSPTVAAGNWYRGTPPSTNYIRFYQISGGSISGLAGGALSTTRSISENYAVGAVSDSRGGYDIASDSAFSDIVASGGWTMQGENTP